MSLDRLLHAQVERLTSLTQLLEQEQQQLTQGSVDGEALTQLAQQKQALLDDIERAERLRRDVQKRLGYVDGLEGARQAADDAGCASSWTALLSKSEQTARLNALTGEMLTLRMTHNQNMLDYIRQIAEKTLYKPDGRNSAQSGRLNTSA